MSNFIGSYSLISQRLDIRPQKFELFVRSSGEPTRGIISPNIRRNSVSLLLDLHIMGTTHQNSVEMATAQGENVQHRWDLMQRVTDTFFRNGVQKVATDNNFFAKNPHCVAATVASTCKIPAIQMELNWADLNLGDANNQFLNIYKSLQDIVRVFEA